MPVAVAWKASPLPDDPPSAADWTTELPSRFCGVVAVLTVKDRVAGVASVLLAVSMARTATL